MFLQKYQFIVYKLGIKIQCVADSGLERKRRKAGIIRARGRADPLKSQAQILVKIDQSVIQTVSVDLFQALV